MSRRSKISRKLLILVFLALLSLQGFCQDSTAPAKTNGELYHQDIEMKKGDRQSVQIDIKKLISQKPDISVHKNALVVEVQNEVLELGTSPVSHMIDVGAKLVTSVERGEQVDIKDIIVEKETKTMILHYIVYDLCNVDESSHVLLDIEALDGHFKGFVSAMIIDLEAFSIQCTDKESETFVAREQHGACEAHDSKVWVFGGKRTIDKTDTAMNDVMVFDTTNNAWKTINPSSGSKPAPRFGHVMFCYFQYFIVFGGQNQDNHILGDLWVFDTIGEKWIFIFDNSDTHELSHLHLEGEVPEARAFSSGVMIPELGAGFITGGQTSKGVACDMWGLKVERVIEFVEDKDKNPLTNFWIKKSFDHLDQSYLCRENHVSALVDKAKFVVWGGLSKEHQFVDLPYTFDIINDRLQVLQQVGEVPEPRIRCGILSTGAGMVILYGGSHLEGKGYYIDLWHFVVNGDRIEYKQVDYELEGDNLFMTWRHGFSLHYVRGIQDPVLIGGTYGNNQQSRSLVSLPEKKCKTVQDYGQGNCSPCPRGSVYSNGQCKWCNHDQYFRENPNNYFFSDCRNCPLGLVGGYYKSCVPCQGGYIYDVNYPEFCKKCDSDQVCPLGTRYAFPYDEFGENFHEVRLDNLPELFNPHQKIFDHTSLIVVFLVVVLTLVLFILIGIFMSMCKEKALFVFREIDVPLITGQGKRMVIGGIIMSFFTLVITIVTIGFFVNYLMFNSRTVLYETKNPFLDRAYPASYLFKINLYTSRFIETDDTTQRTKAEADRLMSIPLPDLCKLHKVDISMSRYFGQAEEKNKDFKCERKQLANGTDEYELTLKIYDIKDEAPENAFVRFSVDSDYEQIFHFFKWEYWNIWRFYEKFPTSYSKISGFVTPQMTTKSNRNITSAFRGPESSDLKFKLTPTHYGNEIESKNFEGYQVFLEEYDRGATINKRNMADGLLPSGLPSSGINIEMFSHVSDTLNHVQVQRQKSLLETLAYIFGFMAGFVLIAHLLKYLLSKEDYFKGLDRE